MLKHRLKSLRTGLGKTQKEMAGLLGITRQGYGNYESGKTEPDQMTINILADFFEVSSDYLLGRTDDPSPTSGHNVSRNQTQKDFHFYNTDGVQFIARSEKNLSPEAYKKLQELAKKVEELFEDEDED